MFGGLDPVTMIAIAIGVLSGITILLFGTAFAGGSQRRFTRRLQEVANRKAGSDDTARGRDAAEQRSLARRGSATPGIDRIFRMLPRRELLVERLSRTGREISVGQYMMVTIAAMVVVIGTCFI